MFSKKVKLPKEYWEKGKSKFLHCRLDIGLENPLKKKPAEIKSAHINKLSLWKRFIKWFLNCD